MASRAAAVYAGSVGRSVAGRLCAVRLADTLVCVAAYTHGSLHTVRY